MEIEIIDPRAVLGWDSLMINSGDYLFFHSSAWAKVLSEAYRYKPVYFAAFNKGVLILVMPFMEIHSSWTGRRGVSLPFTDYCAPFAREGGLLREAAERAIDYGRNAKWQLAEWRGGDTFAGDTPAHESYLAHDLSLEIKDAVLFSRLNESNRRNIRKAVREGVSIEIKRSMDSIRSFYRLNCLTRKRHGLPPQPFRFFEKVFEHIIANGLGIVACATHAGRLLAASVFFLFGSRAIFKYGASDISYQNLRPNNLLMWETILWLKSNNYTQLSLGRTEPENEGLLRYKRGWGGIETPLFYHRYSFEKEAFTAGFQRPHHGHRRAFAKTPIALLRLIGRLAYRHVG